MQIMPDTAKSYDSSLQGLSDAQVREKLINDDAYNMQLGALIYADLYSKYDNDERLVYAAYNGGPGSNGPSADCPGLRKWECEWDSPGCYDTGQTSCTPNTGYIETRNYVQKIPNVASQLP
jgi:soluble lytic murein transglycosylase-like protein